MNKFKVGDKVLTPNGDKGKITRINENYVDVEYLLNDVIEQTFYTHALRFRKTPHERLLELGFIGQEPFWGEYRLYKKGTFINIVIISFNIKDKDYVIWKQNDEVSIEQFYPVNLELAEVLVDYLKELENE